MNRKDQYRGIRPKRKRKTKAELQQAKYELMRKHPPRPKPTRKAEDVPSSTD